MASDAVFGAGPDREALEREVNARIADIRSRGGEADEVSVVATTRGDGSWAEARSDSRMPATEIASEAACDPDSVEDLAQSRDGGRRTRAPRSGPVAAR